MVKKFSVLPFVTSEIFIHFLEVARVRPVFLNNMPKNVIVTIGSRVEFECRVVSYSTPSLIWLFKSASSEKQSDPVQVYSDVVSKEIQKGNKDIQKSSQPITSKFVILNVTFDHQGRYYCTAGNSVSDSKKSTFLTVLSEPASSDSSIIT